MQYQNENQNKEIRQGKLSDPLERERILKRYSGVFKNSIAEYAKRILKKNRPIKNYAR